MTATTVDAARPDFSIGYRRWMFTLLVAVYTCSFLDRVIVNTVGPAIIQELGLSDFEFGLLGGAAFALFYTVFGLPIARLAERFSRVNIIAICIALWSAMTALSGLAPNYAQLLLFRMGVGVGEGGSSPATHSLLSDHYAPSRRASALAIYSLGVPLGIMLGATGGGWIAQTFDWRTAFIVLGLPGLILALLVKITLREPARGRLEPEPATAGAKAPPLLAVIRQMLSQRSFPSLLSGFILTNFAAAGVNTFAPTYLVRTFHLGLAETGMLYGLVTGVSGVIGMLVGGFGADAAGRHDARWYAWAPAIGSLVAMPVYMLAFTQGSALATAALFFVGGVMVSFYFAPTMAVVANLAEPRMRATAAALMFLFINIFGQGVGPTVMGAVSDFMGKQVLAPGTAFSLCPAAVDAPGFVAAACAAPSAAGLRWSILVMTVSFLLGAVCFFRRRALHPPGPGEDLTNGPFAVASHPRAGRLWSRSTRYIWEDGRCGLDRLEG